MPGSCFLGTLAAGFSRAGGTAVRECQGYSGLGAGPSAACLLSRAELKALFAVWEACWQRCCVLPTLLCFPSM